MVCKVDEISLEARLAECPEVLVVEVNKYLARWTEKGYSNVKVIQVEVDEALYHVTGRIDYRVFVENPGLFIIFSCNQNHKFGTISEVSENRVSVYDIQTILERSDHFAKRGNSNS
jgi:hypothetical protein